MNEFQFFVMWIDITIDDVSVTIIDTREISIENINGITKQKMKPWKYLNTC
jgi:hypothetical protein